MPKHAFDWLFMKLLKSRLHYHLLEELVDRGKCLYKVVKVVIVSSMKPAELPFTRTHQEYYRRGGMLLTLIRLTSNCTRGDHPERSKPKSYCLERSQGSHEAHIGPSLLPITEKPTRALIGSFEYAITSERACVVLA